MRNVTRIKELSESALVNLQVTQVNMGSMEEHHIGQAAQKLYEIIDIATELDARTGTIDPSLKNNDTKNRFKTQYQDESDK